MSKQTKWSNPKGKLITPKNLGKHHPYYPDVSYADVIRSDIRYMKERNHTTDYIKKRLSEKWGIPEKKILSLIYRRK